MKSRPLAVLAVAVTAGPRLLAAPVPAVAQSSALSTDHQLRIFAVARSGQARFSGDGGP
jgi:hypothetical protein